jgi:hypothetical protein
MLSFIVFEPVLFAENLFKIFAVRRKFLILQKRHDYCMPQLGKTMGRNGQLLI